MSSFRENTIERAKSICERDLGQLFSIWDEIGIKTEILETYSDQVINHLHCLMKDMKEESIQKKMDLLKNVKSLAQTARKYSKELGTNFNSECHDDLPLIELEMKLKEHVQELQHLKDKRLQFIHELTTKEAEICKKLGTKPIGFDSELPTEQEIKKFEGYLNIQEIEKNRLADIFKDSRRSILKLMEEIHINPSLDFEKMVYQDHNFVYSVSNMTKLRDLKDKLKNQVEEAKILVVEKKKTLFALWDYLDEPEEIRHNFLETYPSYSLVTINALNAEIKRCKEKRSENIANYVKKVRDEITNLWQLCKYSELQKKSFTAMKCHTYTEDLLTLHEMEAENLRNYYNSNRKIFELLSEWEVHFQKLKELDQRANDPDRYHNRGGQLLMEEKERKTVEKKLPKLENQLQILVDEYENGQDKNFLVHGYSLREFMDNKRDNYEIEKENNKLARKQAKDKSMKKTPLSTSKRTPCAASMLRLTPGNCRLRTPGNNMTRLTPAAKRKLPYDTSPNSGNKKRAVVTDKNADKHKNTVLCNKVRRSGRTPGGITLNGSIRVKSGKKKRRSKNDTSLSISSYGNFQEHLENRDELRSSIIPEKGMNKPPTKMITPMKTPMKTPIKPVRRMVLAVSTPNTNTTRVLRGTQRTPRLMNTPRLIQNTSTIEI